MSHSSEAVAARLSAKDLQILETKLALPLRPGTGVVGKGIRLYANYFNVLIHFVIQFSF